MQHKRCWQDTLMNWWAIFSCHPSSAAGAVPQRGQPDIFRWGPGGGRNGSGRALGLSQLSEVVPPGQQMEDYVSWSCVSTIQIYRNQPAGLWIIHESSGFCHCRSHQWNQNLLFQMERQTMHNMSWCTPCDRHLHATKIKPQEWTDT